MDEENRARTPLEAGWAAGRTAWPPVDVPFDAFRRYVAEREADLQHAVELYLVCGCLLDLPGAAAALDQRYLRPVARQLGTLAVGDDAAAEIAQRLAVKLLVVENGKAPRLSEWSGRGSLAGWLRVAATRLAVDLKRRKEHAIADDDPSDVMLTADDIEAALLKQKYGEAFRAAFREALEALAPESKAWLRLHYLEGLTTAQVAALFKVSRPTAVRRIADAKAAVLEDTAHRVASRIGLPVAEAESLIRAMRSQLDVSVARILAEL